MARTRARTEYRATTSTGNNRCRTIDSPLAGPTGALLRDCPRCGAPKGHRCRRWYAPGGYWQPIGRNHRERVATMRRGTCPRCRHNYAVTRDGLIRVHSDGLERCIGSGRPPTEVTP